MIANQALKHIFYNEYLPLGWKIKTVDSVKSSEKHSCVAGPFGSNISSKYFVEKGVPVIRGGNLTIGKEKFVAENFVFISEDKARTFPGQHVTANDLVFTCWGTLGQVGLIPKNGPYEEYIISNKQLKLRPDPRKCNSRFLYYYFSLPQMVQHINDIAIGSAVPGINLGLLKSIKICLPKKNQQDKIAAILSAYDDLIENNKRRIALLEKMSEEIYREWFVRFRFPGYQTAEFEKGIPKGWERDKLENLCLIIKRGISPKYDNESEEVVINQKCIRHGQIDLSVARLHDTKVSKEKYIQYCDALINSTGVGTLGRVSVVELAPKKITVDSHVTICRADPKKIDPLYLATTVAKLQQYFEFMAAGSTGQVELNKSLIEGIKVLVPDESVQHKFRKLVEPILNQKQCLFSKIENLNITKNLLLPRLISGKLSVEDLDIQFPPSMLETDVA